MATLMTLVHSFSTTGGLPVLEDLMVNLFVFLAGGFLFAVLMWNMLEAAYRHYLSQQELQALDRLSAKP
jgi:hypothetical protein